MGKSVSAIIPDIVVLGVIYYLSQLVLRRIRGFFDAVVQKRVTFPI